MDAKFIKISKILLDSICDDYYNLWEPYSEIKEFLEVSDEKLKSDFFKIVKECYHLELISFYKGNSFSGEEKLIIVEISDRFLESLLGDWEDNKNVEIRVTTTIKGDNYFKT